MRAQELRVGNYVDTPAGIKRVVSIVSERSEGVYEIRTATRAVSGEENLFMDYEVSPIPLTEELILKCGFEKHKFSFHNTTEEAYYREDINDIAIILDEENIELAKYKGYFNHYIMCGIGIDDDLVSCGRTFTFLHELQNLTFALTGEELEVKLY